MFCADAGALCALFFLRPVSEKRRRRAVGSGATHAYISLHRKARPTHTLPIAPRWRRLTAIEAAAKAGKDMRRSVGGVQMQHRWHRRVLCRPLLQRMLTRVLCVLFFSAAGATGQRKNLCSGLWGDTRISHSTPHAHTAHRPLVSSIDSLRMTAVQHRSHTPSSSSSSGSSSSTNSTRSPSVVYYFSQPAYIAAVGLFVCCIFQFPGILLQLQNRFFLIWVLASSFKTDSVWII